MTTRDRSEDRPPWTECKEEQRSQSNDSESRYDSESCHGPASGSESRAATGGAPPNRNRPRSEADLAGLTPAAEGDDGELGGSCQRHVARSRFFASVGAPTALVRSASRGPAASSPHATELIDTRTSGRSGLFGAGTSISTPGWGESDNMTSHSFSTGGGGRGGLGSATSYSFESSADTSSLSGGGSVGE